MKWELGATGGQGPVSEIGSAVVKTRPEDLELIKALQEAIEDETKAGPHYRALADQARRAGRTASVAAMLMNIAEQEDEHRSMLVLAVKRLRGY